MPFISQVNGIDFSASYAATSSYIDLGNSQFLAIDKNSYPILQGYRTSISGAVSATLSGGGNNVHVDSTGISFNGNVSLPVGTYNITASQALTASLTTSASFATSASRAISSSFATTASFALTASSLQNNDPIGLTLSVAKIITLQATDSSTGTVNLQAKNIELTGSTGTTITSYGDILPGGPYTNNTSSFNLGSKTAAWKDIFVSNGSINFISGSVSSSIQFNNGQITFPGANLILSSGSTVLTASFATTALSATTSSFASTSSKITGGTANYIPLWSDNVTLGASTIYQNSTNIGIGTLNPAASLDVNGTIKATLVTSSIRTNPGTTTVAPIVMTSGSNLTTPVSGAIEYDGTVMYSTNDTSSQRGYIPSVNIFRLTNPGANISTSANFFGANSAIQLAGGGVYEVEAYCYFTKLTAGTVGVTASFSAAPINVNSTLQYGASAGGNTTGAANQMQNASASLANVTFGNSVSLATLAGHAFMIKMIAEVNANANNLRFLFNTSAGTITPVRGSYYKVTKLPSGNTGNFVA